MQIFNDKKLMKRVLALMLPMMLQNLLNFAVAAADSVMVGTLGDASVAAVTHANQIYMIHETVVFGMCSGGSILISQYWGKRDREAIRNVMKLILAVVVSMSVIYTAVCMAFPARILGLFSNDAAVISEGIKYFRPVLFSYPIVAMSYAYLMALKAVEDVKISTRIYFISGIINVFFNYVFINGVFGAPKLYIAGAAAGTVISRSFELIASIWYNRTKEKNIGFRMFDGRKMDFSEIKRFFRVSIPVVFNDLEWGLGMTVQVAIFGRISQEAAAGTSIVSTALQLAMVAVYGAANAVCIETGIIVGEGDREKLRSASRDFEKLALGIGAAACVLLLTVRSPFLMMYTGVSQEAKGIAFTILGYLAFIMIARSMENTYIIGMLRGAGNTAFALRVDAMCMWLLGIPLGLIGAVALKLPPETVYLLLNLDSFVKIVICFFHIRKKGLLPAKTVTK